jgi:glycosyltransferase involved in cell wall biosynthesis
MRIAVWHNLPSGGGKRALYNHVRGLKKLGHYLESWCPQTADQTYLPLSDLITEHIVPLKMPDNNYYKFNGVVNRINVLEKNCQKCAQEINLGNFDLLYANACMYLRTTAIGKYVNLPKAIYLGEPYRWLYEALPQLPWLALPALGISPWMPKYWKRFIKDYLNIRALRIQAREELSYAKAFNLILANSYYSRESILRSYGLDSQVCYLGVDTDLFYDQKRSRNCSVVGLGAFIPEKNVGFILKALSYVKNPQPFLVWVSNVVHDEYLYEMRQLAHYLNINLEVKVNISDGELVDVLNTSLLLLYAPRLEPFGLAPLEANACGLPVIAVAEGGVRETVIDGQNGLIVDNDPKCMANAIQNLIDNQDYLESLRINCPLVVKARWSLSTSIINLEKKLLLLNSDLKNKAKSFIPLGS